MWVKDKGKVMLQPNPDEAPIFHEIVNIYLNGNLGFTNIALTLNSFDDMTNLLVS